MLRERARHRPACVRLAAGVRSVASAAAAEAAEAGELLEEGVEINLQPSLAEMLDEGIARLKSPQGTWKLWQWPGCPTDFFSADDFKCGPAAPPRSGRSRARVGRARSLRVAAAWGAGCQVVA